MPEITIYGDIVEEGWGYGVSAQQVYDSLSGITGDLTIRIKSGGGDVYEGHAIYNLLDTYDGYKTVIIDGIAASAASVIAMAGDVVQMPINAELMIHDPWTIAIGNSADMQKTAQRLDDIKSTIVKVYARKTGLDSEVLSQMMTDETWLNADKAEELGFAVKNTNEKTVNNKIEKKKWINKIPKHLLNELDERTFGKEEVSVIEPEPEPEKIQYPNNEARKRILEIEAEAL